jgi:hypothetical protein
MDQKNDPVIVREILQLRRQAVTKWFCEMGRLSQKNGARAKRFLSGKECWAFLLGRTMFRRGELIEDCHNAYKAMDRWSTADIIKWLEQGSTAVAMVNGRVLPKLVHASAMFTGENQKLVDDAKRAGYECRVLVIDGRALWLQIRGFLSGLAEVTRD